MKKSQIISIQNLYTAGIGINVLYYNINHEWMNHKLMLRIIGYLIIWKCTMPIWPWINTDLSNLDIILIHANA